MIEVNSKKMLRTAHIGAAVLTEIYKILDIEDIDSRLSVACLASAVAGALKATGMTTDAFVAGIDAHDDFWEDDGEFVVFKPIEEEKLNNVFEEILGSKETN